MSDHCGTVTEDGYAVCTPSASGEVCSCSTSTQIVPEKDLSIHSGEASVWKKIRSGVMFGIACVASLCCTQLSYRLDWFYWQARRLRFGHRRISAGYMAG